MDGQRKALIVATDEYENEGLRNLLAPAADAEALSRVLGDPQVGGFDVQMVRNQPAHVVKMEIEEILTESRPEDVLLLHFSCHGLKSESGELFFAARDTRPNRLGASGIAAGFVQSCMRQSRSRSIVLLLDCCYGGAFSQGVMVRAAGNVNVFDSFPREKQVSARGRAVITASNSMEYAFESDQLADDRGARPSVFTAAVIEGLETGDADRDQDGWISLNELYDYVFDRVREQNPHQTPSRDVEMQGEFYLARSRRHIRPAPIPPELEAARNDPNMYTRLGAVNELHARLMGGNLAAAAGACEILQDIVRTDNRLVAEAAEAALHEADVHPDTTEINFGRIGQGRGSGHRGVQLLGPAIARACQPRASRHWILVTETNEGLAVAVDTSQLGPHQGRIDVKGYTGLAAISVSVEVFPLPQPEEKPSPPIGPPPRQPPQGPPAPPSSRQKKPPPREPAFRRGPKSVTKIPVAGPILLSIPLFILALYFADGSSNALGRWVVLVTAAVGCIVAAVEFRRTRIWAVALEVGFIWCLLYIIYNLTPRSFHEVIPIPTTITCSLGHHVVKWPVFYAAVTGAAAIANVAVLATSFRKRSQVAHPLLYIFLTCMAIGFGFVSIGHAFFVHYPSCNWNLVRAGAWFLFAALAVNMLALAAALTRRRPTGPSEVTAPTRHASPR